MDLLNDSDSMKVIKYAILYNIKELPGQNKNTLSVGLVCLNF